MKCGVAAVATNWRDWDRINAKDWTRPPSIPDHVILDQAIEIGDMIEPLGFDSIWSSEHFATPYGMTPNALQFLAFWAGRTKKVDLGSIVVVLPWWHPVKVAHEIAMLDILLQGRNYTIGVGRGLSPKEFGPLGVPQEEARQRFNEIADVIRLGFTKERFSYDGKIFKIPEMSIRPQPRHRDMMDRAVAAVMTPTSLEAAAKNGLGQIIVAAASFDQVGKNTALFNKYRKEAGLTPNSQPIVYMFAYCADNDADLERAEKYRAESLKENDHYGFSDPSTFANMKGYEAYAEMAKTMNRKDPAGATGITEMHQWLFGKPDQIIKTIKRMQEQTSARELVLAFNFGVDHESAKKSIQLFAKEVLPAVQEMPALLHAPAMAEAAE